MRSASLIIIIFIFCVSVTASYADISLATGASNIIELEKNIEINPEIQLFTGFDTFIPLSQVFSFFITSGGYFYANPVVLNWRYVYDLSIDISYRNSFFLFKPTIRTSGEQYYLETVTFPEYWDHSLDLLFSFDIEDNTLFLIPAFSWEKVYEENYYLDGTLGISSTLMDTLLFTGKFLIGKSILESMFDELYLSPTLELTWYPNDPYILTTVFSLIFHDSDFEEEFGDVFLNSKDFAQAYLNIELSSSISNYVILEIMFPSYLTFKDHPAINQGVLNTEREWIYTLEPALHLSIDSFETHKWIFSILSIIDISNSDYQQENLFTFSVQYEWNFY